MQSDEIGISQGKAHEKSAEELVKSKQRVADHGEVFTPSWMVEDMLNLVKTESERIDSRFLEPACGSGNFLTSVLKRKLASVQCASQRLHGQSLAAESLKCPRRWCESWRHGCI